MTAFRSPPPHSNYHHNQTVVCPTCSTKVLLEPADLNTLGIGDALICEGCNAELELISTDPHEFRLLGIIGRCGCCQHEVSFDPDIVVGEQMQCPHCDQYFASPVGKPQLAS
jgi:DNA-directed RNA polymerase subunit RPC12/RpoP